MAVNYEVVMFTNGVEIKCRQSCKKVARGIPFVSAHERPTVRLMATVKRPRRIRFTGCCWW
jgi:hypothetical protein